MKRGEIFARGFGAAVFDCCEIPTAFVEDTGQCYFEEAEAIGEAVRLPYQSALFCFDDDENIFAEEASLELCAGTKPIAVSPADRVYIYDTDGIDSLRAFNRKMSFDDGMNFQEQLRGEFLNGFEVNDDMSAFEKTDTLFVPHMLGDLSNGVPDFADLDYQKSFAAAYRALGVLSLLRDKLISSTIRPDPNIKETMRRLRRKQPSLTGETHVLTVNVGAVRRATRNIYDVSHGPPALHWRRGHWRINHRGSEFESRSWIRRCLVGDPDKGFVRKAYRLVDQPSLIGAQEQ